jgi:hypothetical protein
MRPLMAARLHAGDQVPSLGQYDEERQLTVDETGRAVVLGGLGLETLTKASGDRPQDPVDVLRHASLETLTRSGRDRSEDPVSAPWVAALETATRTVTDPADPPGENARPWLPAADDVSTGVVGF